MFIGFPSCLFSSASSGAAPAGVRAVASNSNVLPYTFSLTTNRVHNIRKKRVLASNANWTLPVLEFANWTDNSTSESISYPTISLRQSLKYQNTIYRASYSSSFETIVINGQSVASSPIVTPSMLGGSEVEICTTIVLPLLYKNQTANFSINEIVTGASSGAIGTIKYQVDSGATGALTLVSESGNWLDGETINGSLGGSALVDLSTPQSLIASHGTLEIWNEGIRSGGNAAVDYSATDPVTYPVFNAVKTGNNITSATMVSPGTGWTVAPSVFAWEFINGKLWKKAIGYGNPVSGGITSIFVQDGTPPTGLAAWVNPKLTFAGGSGFGVTTSVVDAALLTAIPSNPVKSLIIAGDSIARGFWSADGVGDDKHNFGLFERGVYNRVGVINMSTPGTSVANQLQFGTTFSRQYNFYMGRATHCLVTMGTNDLGVGTTKTALKTMMATYTAYIRSFGTSVSMATLIPRAKPFPITGISKSNYVVISAINTLSNSDVVSIDNTVQGMTQIRGAQGLVINRTPTSFEILGLDSTAFSTYTSGGNVYCFSNVNAQTPETGFNIGGFADQYNADILSGSIPSDWGYVHYRPLLQDTVVTSSWKTSPANLTDDLIHPSLIGINYVATDTGFKNNFNILV